jgi:hypothetical protein
MANIPHSVRKIMCEEEMRKLFNGKREVLEASASFVSVIR